ncbi:MAG: hypothetical protein ACREC4_10570 [Methylocella sp.]
MTRMPPPEPAEGTILNTGRMDRGMKQQAQRSCASVLLPAVDFLPASPGAGLRPAQGQAAPGGSIEAAA